MGGPRTSAAGEKGPSGVRVTGRPTVRGVGPLLPVPRGRRTPFKTTVYAAMAGPVAGTAPVAARSGRCPCGPHRATPVSPAHDRALPAAASVAVRAPSGKRRT
ncbi:hypothetical protein GCM10027162_18140 [Streptomyces incanus]